MARRRSSQIKFPGQQQHQKKWLPPTLIDETSESITYDDDNHQHKSIELVSLIETTNQSVRGVQTTSSSNTATTVKDPEWNIIDTLTFGAVGFAMTMAIMVIVLYDGIFLYACMAVSLSTSTLVAYQRALIRKEGRLRTATNKIREEVNGLMSQNDSFRATNFELQNRATKLADVEKRLQNTMGQQAVSVGEFRKSVEENRDITDHIRKTLEAKLVFDLVSAVIKADRDEDFIIDLEEVDGLCWRFESFTNVIFDGERFRERMKRKGYGFNAVIDIVDNIFDDRVPYEKKIFKIDVKGLKVGDV